MLIVATVFFFVAALMGALLLSVFLQGKHLSKRQVLTRVISFTTGLVPLVLYAVLTDKPDKLTTGFVIFAVATLLGLYLFQRRKNNKPVP